MKQRSWQQITDSDQRIYEGKRPGTRAFNVLLLFLKSSFFFLIVLSLQNGIDWDSARSAFSVYLGFRRTYLITGLADDEHLINHLGPQKLSWTGEPEQAM